jgi:hypothetical protein
MVVEALETTMKALGTTPRFQLLILYISLKTPISAFKNNYL